jgi:hypothetical protein
VQIVLPKQDVPTGTALLSLFQTLGGAVFVAVGQNVFIDKFTSGLGSIPGIHAEQVVRTGATGLTSAVPPQSLPQVLEAYNTSLTQGPFFAALIVACLALPAALGMEWRSVKEGQQPPVQAAAADEENLTAESNAQQPSTSVESGAERSTTPEMAEPTVPAYKRAYRSSGQLSHWVTARVNPDLADELERIRKEST